jgi:hypothetical protein
MRSAAFFILRCAMRISVEAEVVWLRFVKQILVEDAVVDRMRAAS